MASSSLEIKKMRQGMSYSGKEKTIIMNVFKYFRTQFSEDTLTETVRKTAKATGCSEKSIFSFRKEEASPQGFKEPSKKKIRKNINTNNRLVKYDENTRDCIKNIIYDLKSRNITPSLSTILKNVKCNDRLPNFSLMTLRRLLFDMGFYYEKNGTKSILLEKGADETNIQAKVTNSETNTSSAHAYYVTSGSNDTLNCDKKFTIPTKIEAQRYGYCSSNNEKATVIMSPKVVTYSIHSMEPTSYYTSHVDLREAPFGISYNSSHSLPQNLLLH